MTTSQLNAAAAAATAVPSVTAAGYSSSMFVVDSTALYTTFNEEIVLMLSKVTALIKASRP